MPYNKTQLTTPVQLSFVEFGAGTPILLVHGFPLDHTIWSEQINDLRNICRVVAPDLRGHGKSPAPEGAYSVDLMAKDLIALLDRIGVYKAIWVGHSMGGYITMAAQRLAPERFAGLGLVCTNHKADSEEARAKRYETAEKVGEEGSKAAVNTKMFLEGTPETTPYVEATKQIMLNTPAAGIIGSLQAIATRPDSTDSLKQVRVPVVVIAGEGDQLFKPEIPQQMAQLIPGAELVMVPKAGHMAMMEQIEIVTNALHELIRRVEQG